MNKNAVMKAVEDYIASLPKDGLIPPFQLKDLTYDEETGRVSCKLVAQPGLIQEVPAAK